MNVLKNQETVENLIFTVPLTAKFKRQAKKFSRGQFNLVKSKQVYGNTLAVLAVNFYCKCMGIETDLEDSESWNPAMQTLADVADLSLKNIGTLECLPVLPGSKFVKVPREVWSERIGYIAVELNESISEAKLIGFVEEVTREEVPLDEWRSLECFLEQVEKLELNPPVTQLTKWLEGIFDAGWETVETIQEMLLLQDNQATLAWRGNQATLAFRDIGTGKKPMIKQGKNEFKRGKLVELEKAGEKVALFVGFNRTEAAQTDIFVEVYPLLGKGYLPQDLRVTIMDGKELPVMNAIARTTKNIQLDFSAESGENFQVKLSLGDVNLIERFQI